MKKMMLLASVMGLVALMLAAAPAFAQDGGDKVTICHIPPGNPGNAHTISVGEAAVLAHLAHGDRRGPCVFDRDVFDRDVFDRDVVDVVPVISQDIEQEAESGDIDQSFDVSQTGDNSNQTVGIQGTANTGNAQNAIGVIDAGDFNNNNDGFVFCDRDRDGNDDGDDDCFVIFPDFNDGFFNDGDRVFVNDGNNDDGDIEIEDSGAEITMSPNNTTNSSQQVNQAAAASAPHWVWTGSEWVWMVT